MDLTSEESKKIKENRKAEENLPTYYSAALNKEIAISRDFEGFLILSSKDTLQNAVGWLDKLLTINSGNIDRNELRKAYLKYDRNLLVADVRRKEAYKPGDSKARSKRQSSKR